jgi:hypothetical protein
MDRVMNDSYTPSQTLLVEMMSPLVSITSTMVTTLTTYMWTLTLSLVVMSKPFHFTLR